MIYMLWDECVLPSFYKYICKAENCIYLNDKNVLYLKTSEIVWSCVPEDLDNYENMKSYQKANCNVIQYIQGLLFPIIYATGAIRSIILKGEFQLKFKKWNNKKAQKNVGKNPEAYQKRTQINKFEQNSVKMDLSHE